MRRHHFALLLHLLIGTLICDANAIKRPPTAVRTRSVSITADMTLSVMEIAQPAPLVEDWSNGIKTASDPFGVVLWPGALYAARHLCSNPLGVKGATCLIVGAGTGLEALTAAALGASKVIAIDINPLTLNLLADAARYNGLGDCIETRVFDLMSPDDLPAADILISADTLYTRELCKAVASRCRQELWSRGSITRLLLTTSQQFAWIKDEFVDELNARPPEEPIAPGREWRRLEWANDKLERFTGSGILLDEDQTYDASIRFMDVRHDVES